MQVDEQHNERAQACVAEFFTRMVAAGIDRGALAVACFDMALSTMNAMDGPGAVASGLREYAEAYDRRYFGSQQTVN